MATVNTISFELTDGAISKFDMKFEKYTDYTADYENEGVYYVADGAEVSQTCTVKFEQVIGEKTATNPYDIEAMYYQDFNFKDGDTVVTDTIVMDAGVQKQLSLVDVVPATANPGVDKITLTEATGKVNASYNSSGKYLGINCREVGEYDVTISTKNVSKQYKVVVNKPVVSSMEVNYYVQSGSQFMVNMISNENSTVTTYTNTDVYFKASCTPSLADQEYTIEAVGDNKDNLTIEAAEIKTNPGMPKAIAVHKVVTSVAGTYTVRFTSVSNSDVSREVTIVVNEPPAVEELVAKRYVSATRGVIYVDINFVPDSSDASKGKVSINDMYSDATVNGDYSYTYDAATRKFALVKLDNEGNTTEDAVAIGLEFDGNYNLTLVKQNSTTSLKEFSHSLMIVNAEWQGRDSNTAWVQFSFSADGTGRFGYQHIDYEIFETIAEYYCVISYTIEEREDGVYIVLDAASKAKIYESEIVSEIGDIKVSSDYKTLSVTATIKGNVENCDLTRGG